MEYFIDVVAQADVAQEGRPARQTVSLAILCADAPFSVFPR